MVSADASERSTSSSSSSGGGAPKPMPMAIMRNAHEAIRGAMADIQTHLDADDFDGAKALWHRFHRFSDLHMKMEEGRKGCNAKGLFRLVDDHAEEVAKKAGLRHHHSTLYELEEDVVDIFENSPDINRAKEVYPIFRQENEAHLKEEEGILMPALQKMMKQGVPVKKYIISDILPVLLLPENDDMEFFVKFANDILQQHEEGKPRVRVFDHGLWALAASPEQWKEWDKWIQDTLTTKKYVELQDAIQAFKAEQKQKAPPSKKGILKTEDNKGKMFANFKKMFTK